MIDSLWKLRMAGRRGKVNLGEATLFGSVPLLVWFMIFFALNALAMPLIEEAHLESRLGSDYVTYKRNVPRWIPRLNPWRPGEHRRREDES
jgi:protein-S-isoprenylcysteine O-methyltransferase Ste14